MRATRASHKAFCREETICLHGWTTRLELPPDHRNERVPVGDLTSTSDLDRREQTLTKNDRDFTKSDGTFLKPTSLAQSACREENGRRIRREARPDVEDQEQEMFMKLNSTQIEQTLNQFNARVITEDNPTIAELNDLFGDHTFFLDARGLNVLEL